MSNIKRIKEISDRIEYDIKLSISKSSVVREKDELLLLLSKQATICRCEIPAKTKGKKICWRCKKYLN